VSEWSECIPLPMFAVLTTDVLESGWLVSRTSKSIGKEKSNPACVRTGLGVASHAASAVAGVYVILSGHRHSS
jgi:hypothetical protein